MDCHPSHWRTHIFHRGWNHQPDILVPRIYLGMCWNLNNLLFGRLKVGLPITNLFLQWWNNDAFLGLFDCDQLEIPMIFLWYSLLFLLLLYDVTYIYILITVYHCFIPIKFFSHYDSHDIFRLTPLYFHSSAGKNHRQKKPSWLPSGNLT